PSGRDAALRGRRVLRAVLHRFLGGAPAPQEGPRVISVRDVYKSYGEVEVLAACSVEVRKGEVIVVCGPSGSGKSTLIKCINGLEPFERGQIVVHGVEVGRRGTDLSRLRE